MSASHIRDVSIYMEAGFQLYPNFDSGILKEAIDANDIWNG